MSDLTARLLAWHDPDARGLPWRATRDPYAVLVSEVMAQQTQAARAATAWSAFLRRWPTVRALAAAPVAEVIEAWQGLGYNRRAINLHRCAAVVVAEHGGALPDDLAALQALPGIGPYTARAVLAFAFGRPVLPVDTNVARVLARTSGDVLTRPEAQRRADGLAAAAGPDDACVSSPGSSAASHACVDGGGTAPDLPADLAAALMDLGATTCTARRPRCDECPLQPVCTWAGGPDPDPAAAGAHRPRPQGTFAGSARQARGRVVDALRGGPITGEEAVVLAGAHGAPLLDRLVADGLVERTATGFALPGWTGRSGPAAIDRGTSGDRT